MLKNIWLRNRYASFQQPFSHPAPLCSVRTTLSKPEPLPCLRLKLTYSSEAFSSAVAMETEPLPYFRRHPLLPLRQGPTERIPLGNRGFNGRDYLTRITNNGANARVSWCWSCDYSFTDCSSWRKRSKSLW